VSVGTLLLEAAEYEAAASAFENALALDGEDIAALGGYCKAQLALGDRARDEGESDRAIEFYQAVLAINPEHSAAREGLGVIYRQQAEASLSAGQDEAALLAFRTALGYLPEDEELTNRVQQVMDEKHAKAIAALIARSDGAQANGDWEAAIAALQDALALAGRDEALEKKLAGVKVSQRAYLLATLPDQARRQEKDEDWEEAIAIWQKYLGLYPEDQGTAKAALDKAQQMGAIQAKYTQAQAALEGKDYYRSIELLQGIVQVDPGYKDTPRLLASAVGASRRGQVNLFRRTWYALPILFILITAGAFFGLRGSVQIPTIAFQGATATPTTTETLSVNLASTMPALSSNPTSALSRTPMPAPSPSPTPTSNHSPTPYPEWVTDFAEPILNIIAERPPDFEDDFSTPIQEPGYLVLNGQDADVSEYITDDGKLELEGKIEMTLGSQQFKAHDFALQYEIDPNIANNLREMGIEYRIGGTDENNKFIFNPVSGNWIFYRGNVNSVIARGRDKENLELPVKILLLVKGDKFAVYRNDEPLAFVQYDEVWYDTNQIIISSYGEQFNAAIDNVKFWNLEAEIISDETNICTVKWPIYAKSDPDPNGRIYIISNRIEVGKPIRVIESSTGTDGKTWYYIRYDQDYQDPISGLRGWVPESSLSEACRQLVPTPTPYFWDLSRS
jgi:tetratricopeptide (TPR) repeat protein